jgi:hypothetical protein
LKAGEEIDGINCSIADFLSGMSPDPADPVIVCADAAESRKRSEQRIGGQLWIQGPRTMTATNVIPDGMKNEASSAALIAVAEAVEGNTLLNREDKSTKARESPSARRP